MRDIRQSPNYAKYMESLGWIVEKGAFIKKLWFTSVVKAQRFSSLPNLSFLKKYHPFLIKLEPLKETNISGFKKDSWPMLPTKTIILDLNNLNLPKDTRYEIRKASGLKVRVSTDIELFYKLLAETMKIGHWSVPIHKEVSALWQAFQPNNSVILLCHPELVSGSLSLSETGDSHSREMLKRVQHDTPIAGCLLIWDGNTAHYMYAALTKRGRELGAAYFTLWETIKFCQRKKLKYLDLEGIYDERRAKDNKNWQGFTKFKMGWGGKVVEYPGSWTKYCLPTSMLQLY